MNQDWELETYCLACTSSDIDHTAINIKYIIESTLENWNIPLSKVCAATSDNGSNVIKAVQLMKLNHISCFGHTLNNWVTLAMTFEPIKNILSKVTKLRYTFHYSSKLRRLLLDAQSKLDLPQKVMPASCITRWWTSLPALQFVRDHYDALYDVLYKLKSKKIKYLPNDNEQKLIVLICKVFEPLKTLGEHMGAEKVVTASTIWPVYSKLEETLLLTNESNYTCDLTQQELTTSSRNDYSQQIFTDDDMNSYFNTIAVEEKSDDDDDVDMCNTVDNVNTVNNLLGHIEDHLKRAIKTPFQKLYILNDDSKIFLQNISVLDPRYRLTYIAPIDINSITSSIKLEMDEIGNQVEKIDHINGPHDG